MIWNSDIEQLDREALQKKQLASFKDAAERVYERVPFYRKKFQEAGVTPEALRSLEDISKLPFTTKDEMRGTYPYGLLAVPESEIVEIHTSSGTTGTPVVDAYTAKDIDAWGRRNGPHPLHGRRRSGRCGTERIRLRALYRRARGALRCRKLGANVIPVSAGKHQAAAHDYA